MEEDCLKNNQIASGPSNNPKPKSENNAWKEVVGVNTRTQLFNEIEAVNPDNDYNITIMTSNLSLDTGTHKEPEPVKDLEEISRLRELYEEMFLPKQNPPTNPYTISSLASLCDKVVIAQLMCPECKIVVTDKRKHTILTGCRIFPFPFTAKTVKLDKIWPLNKEKDIDGPASM